MESLQTAFFVSYCFYCISFSCSPFIAAFVCMFPRPFFLCLFAPINKYALCKLSFFLKSKAKNQRATIPIFVCGGGLSVSVMAVSLAIAFRAMRAI